MRCLRRAALAAAVLLPGLALAHGDAAWIQNEPSYRMRTRDVHCCDVSHCHAGLPPGGVRLVAEGIEVIATGQVFVFDTQGLYQSIDDRWWWCGRFGQDDAEGGRSSIVMAPDVWCLFRPGAEG